MSFTSAKPANIVKYSVRRAPIAYEKTFEDCVTAVDVRMSKNVSTKSAEVVITSDLLSKGVVISPVELVKCVDWFLRTRIIELIDCLVDEGYMAKGIRWHLREWWVFVKDYALFKEFGKVLTDYVVAYDYKGFVIKPKDVVIPCDVLFKGIGRIISEPVRAADVIVKGVVAHVFDAWRPWERLDRFYKGTMEVMDLVSSVDFLSKGVSPILRDFVRGYDYKGFVPRVLDAIRAVDLRVLVGKGIAMRLIDRFVDEGYVARLTARAARDVAVPSDFLLKVGFTLFGEAARRVYFHKVHGDIIMPEDHNVRNIAAQALVEAVKRLKDKLSQL